jgi:hypothetical protein
VLNIGQCVPLDSVKYSYIGVDNRLAHLPCLDVPEIWGIQKKVLSDTPSIRTVVLAARWSNFLPGNSSRATMSYTSMVASDASLSQEQIFEDGLSRTIDYIESKGKKVIFFLDNPEMNFNVSSCVARPFESAETKRLCGISREAVMERQEAIRRVAAHLLVRHPGLQIFDPVPYLCRGDFCPAMEDGKLVYRDINHLSFYGSDKLAQVFVPSIR